MFAMASLAMAATGCRSSNPYKMDEGATAQVGRVVVHVVNNNFSDMDIYVVSEGLATRMGTVSGNSSDTFTLDPSFSRISQLQIVGAPIGGNGRAGTGPLTVGPGQTVEFTIGPVLSQSTVTIR